MNATDTDAKLAWEPSTHHSVPQPAGRLCAEWYKARAPSDEDLLYALAHTKGLADELLTALQACLSVGFDTNFPDARTAQIREQARSAIRKAQA